jgi:hypothetical protein
VKKLRRCSTLALAVVALIAVGGCLALRGLEERYDAAVKAELAALDAEGLGPAPAPAPFVNVGPAIESASNAIGEQLLDTEDPTSVENAYFDQPDYWKATADDPKKLAAHEEALGAVIARFERTLPELDRALASDRTGIAPEIDPDQIPWTYRALRIMGLLHTRITHDLRVGRAADGWPDVERLLQLARAVDRKHFLLGLGVEAGCAGSAVRDIERLLPHAQPDRAMAERLDRLLVQLDHPRVRDAVRGAIDIFLRSVPADGGKIVDAPIREPSTSWYYSAPPLRLRRWRRLPRPIRAATVQRDRARTVQLYAAAIRALEHPFPEAWPRIVELSKLETTIGPLSSPVVDDNGYPLRTVVRQDAELRVQLRSARVLLAAMRADVPETCPLALEDPLLPGSTLRYRRTGRKVTVWSVGLDGKDDGGLGPNKNEFWSDAPDLVIEAEIAPVASR